MTQQPERDKTAADGSALGGALPILSSSPVFWRSLEELASRSADGGLAMHDDPGPAVPWLDEPSRRDFLRIMAASLAMGGAGGCAIQPAESIVPYVQAPEQIIPGKPLFFASAVPIDGFACGVLIKSEMGRPIKIEGNPGHPASLGATDVFAQAAVLSLYDPDRSQLVIHNGRIDTWEHFQAVALGLRERLRDNRGSGLRILTGTVASPTLADQLRRLLEQFPQAKWQSYEPVSRDAIRAGCRLVFGEELEPLHHLDRADVILSLEADFLAWGPGRLKDARAFAQRRGAGEGGAQTR